MQAVLGSPLFTWPERRSRPAQRAKPMDDVASSIPKDYATPDEHPRLDWHLDNWAVYTYTGGLKHLRVKMPSWWSSGSNDFDKMVSAMDSRCPGLGTG